MSPLGYAEVDVPFGTLNQVPADHQGPVGRVTTARNVVVEHYDKWRVKVQQRNAFLSLTTDATSPDTGSPVTVPWDSPQLLSVLDDQLLSIAASVPRVYNGTTWTGYADERVVTRQLSESVFHTSQRTIQAPSSTVMGGVTCSVWAETLQAEVPSIILYIGFKASNGAWVVPPKVLYDPGGGAAVDVITPMARVTSDADRFWVVYNATGADEGPPVLVISCYSPGGVFQATTFITQNNQYPLSGYWDIQADDAGGIVIAQPLDVPDGSDVDVEVSSAVFDSGGIVVTTSDVGGAHSSGPVAWLTNKLGDGLHYLGTHVEGTGIAYGYQVTALLFTHEFAIAGIPNKVDSITGFMTAGVVANQPTATLSISILPTSAASSGPAFDPAFRYTRVRQCTWAGVATNIKDANSVCQVSRAFEIDDTYYALTYYQSGSGLALTQRSENVVHTAGDYMVGASEQPVDVSVNDYVSGSPGLLTLQGTAVNGFYSMLCSASGAVVGITGTDNVALVTSSGLLSSYGIPDGVQLLRWQFANSTIGGAGGAPTRGALLTVGSSSIASANGTWDIIGGPSVGGVLPTTVYYTALTNHSGGTVVPGTFTATGSMFVNPVTAYCAPLLSEYVDTASASLLEGGTITVSGLFGANNGTFTVLRLTTDVTGSYQSYFMGPAVWVITTTQSTFEGVTASAVLSANLSNTWHFAGRTFDDSMIGATLSVSGSPNDANNGDFPITGTLGGNLVTGGETSLEPELWTGALPTVTIRLPLTSIPLTFFLQSLTLDYTFIGALVSVQDSPNDANNGVYTITQINDDGTFYAIATNGATGQVSQLFLGETITIFFLNNIAPVFQPCWFLTPLAAVDTVQAGRFEYGIAYADWRIEADDDLEVNPYFLHVADVYETGDGLQVVLPYRAESFTSGAALTTPSGQNVNAAVTTFQSTVGLKAFTISETPGLAIETTGALMLPGTVAAEFSTSGFHENGFNVIPEQPFLISQDESSAALALTPRTTRQYVVTFEGTGENGDRIYSAPSPALSSTLTGDNNVNVIGGRMPTGLTGRQVTISIYATSYQGTTPTVQHYKITNDLNANGLAPVSTNNASGFSFPDAFTWNYRDENPDVSILTSEILYTDKGYLPRFPAPAFRDGTVWKNRTWVIGYDGAVWFSGEKTEGDATWFFPAFRVLVDDVPTSLAAMDDYLLIFCRDSIWYLPASQLPGANGAGGSIATPVRLPFTNGCTGFSAVIKAGAVYASTAGGVWLITRGLENKWLGQAIRDLLTVPVTGFAIDDAQRLHVATGTAGWYVYDQVVDCWYEWRQSSVTAGLPVAWNGQATWQDAALVATYTPGSYADIIGATTYGITMRITFASINFAKVSAMVRLWEMQLVGTYKGPHRVNVTMSYPDQNDDAPDTLYDPYVPVFGEPYVYPFNPMIENASTFGVTLETDFEGVEAPANSAEWELLACQVGVDTRAGLNKTVKRILAR